MKTRRNYRKDLLQLGESILQCPHFHRGGKCHRELADLPAGIYEHGPEISFVGSAYGQKGLPRILFTRLNPTWNSETGWFGTLESLTEYRAAHPKATVSDIYMCYLKGWHTSQKTFRGMWDAGTVTGHPNSGKSGEEKRDYPRYGIQAIMEEMIRAGVFPKKRGSVLQFCAINNVIKCAGRKRNWNPSDSMYKNCNHYEAELDLLQPHIVIALGKKTENIIKNKLQHRITGQGTQITLRLSNGQLCHYFSILHPTGQGKSTWRGTDIQHLKPDRRVRRRLTKADRERFRAGPGGISTERLFTYILYLVGEALKVKENL